MGRRVTWLVVGAVAAVAVAATVEALLGEPEAQSTSSREPGASATIDGGEGLRGVLYYTDANCTLRALRLPESRPAPAPEWQECTFSLGPSEGEVGSAGSVWDPGGESSASESEGIVYASVFGTQSISFRGSAPAYRRTGTLTFVRDGALRLLLLGSGCLRLREPVQFVREDLIDRCSRVLLRPGDLRRLALLHPSAPADPSLLRQVTVKAHAWLDDARLVLLLAVDVLAAGRFEQVVVVGGRSAIAVVPVSGGRLSALQVSPRGRYFAVRAEDPDAVLLFDRDGNALDRPSLTRAHALAWSPGERWTAVATDDGVEIWRTTAPNRPLRQVGIRAGDLAWRLG
jgi:hypothetical protein